MLFFNSHSLWSKFSSFLSHPLAYKMSLSFSPFINSDSKRGVRGGRRDSWCFAYRLFSIEKEKATSLFRSWKMLFAFVSLISSGPSAFTCDCSVLERESNSSTNGGGSVYLPNVKLKLLFCIAREVMFLLERTFRLMKVESWLLWFSVEIVLSICFFTLGLMEWLNW